MTRRSKSRRKRTFRRKPTQKKRLRRTTFGGGFFDFFNSKLGDIKTYLNTYNSQMLDLVKKCATCELQFNKAFDSDPMASEASNTNYYQQVYADCLTPHMQAIHTLEEQRYVFIDQAIKQNPDLFKDISTLSTDKNNDLYNEKINGKTLGELLPTYKRFLADTQAEKKSMQKSYDTYAPGVGGRRRRTRRLSHRY